MGIRKSFNCRVLQFVLISIGYYTVDYTIPKYIWTSTRMTIILDMPIGEFNMVKSSGCESKMKMPRLNYMLFLLSYHVNNKTLHTFDF